MTGIQSRISIGGKPYTFEGQSTSKTLVNKHADKWRSKGHLARVVPVAGGYALYVRTKNSKDNAPILKPLTTRDHALIARMNRSGNYTTE